MSGNNRDQQNKNSLPLPGGSKNSQQETKVVEISKLQEMVSDEESGKIRVKAIRAGFFNQERIPEGREFEIENESQLGSWMALLDEEKEKARRVKLKHAFRKNMLHLNDD